jgi:hypothetical protein
MRGKARIRDAVGARRRTTSPGDHPRPRDDCVIGHGRLNTYTEAELTALSNQMTDFMFSITTAQESLPGNVSSRRRA